MAQRLVRKVCPKCRVRYEPPLHLLAGLGLRPEIAKKANFMRGKGCNHCNKKGFRGRQGIYEIMLFDDDLRDQIVKHASTQILRHESKKRGMRTLRTSGLMAIYDGVTTIEEVVRETIMEEG